VFEFSATFEQKVYFVSLDHYNEQVAKYNQVIQATVAAAMEGLVASRVTNITMTAMPYATTEINMLQYTVKVHDQALTYDVLHAQLLQSVVTGKMDADLHFYATHFLANNLQQGTFIAPSVLAHGEPADGTLTHGAIAGIVIGIVAFAVLACLMLLACCRRRHSEHQTEAGDEIGDLDSIYVQGPDLV